MAGKEASQVLSIIIISRHHFTTSFTRASMQVNSAQGTMAAIAAAVTPVVMISANAILIGTISSKHQAMSDRVRALTAEWRAPGTSAAGGGAISAGVGVWGSRIAWISRAH